jgi:hypothetical protein
MYHLLMCVMNTCMSCHVMCVYPNSVALSQLKVIDQKVAAMHIPGITQDMKASQVTAELITTSGGIIIPVLFHVIHNNTYV